MGLTQKIPGFLGLICVLSLAAHASPAAAAADTCQSIHLDAKGGSMDGIPVRDQGDVGICYAEVATELFDSYRKKHPSAMDSKLTRDTSPVYTAVQFALDPKNGKLKCPKDDPEHKGKKKFAFEGGWACEAFDSIWKGSACSEDAVNSAFFGPYDSIVEKKKAEVAAAKVGLARTRAELETAKKRKYKREKDRREALSMAETMIDAATKRLKNANEALNGPKEPWPKLQNDVLRTLYNDGVLKAACDKIDSQKKAKECETAILQELSPGKPQLPSMENEIKNLTEGALADFKNRLDEKACGKSGVKVSPPAGQCGPSCKEEKPILETIQTQLSNAGALPVGIALCSAIFASPNELRFWKEKEKITLPADGNWTKNDKCAPHAVMIIGQQKNTATGKCQLIIRNSWGTRCDSNCKGPACQCEEGTGNTYVDADLVLKNAMGIQVIEEKPKCN